MSPLNLSLQHSPELVDPVIRDELEHLQAQIQTWSKTVEFPGLSATSGLGRWQPVLGGDQGTTGQGYLTQYGLYTTLGQLVIAHFVIALQAKGSIVGVLELQGLPVPCRGEIADTFVAGPFVWQNFDSRWVNLCAILRPNTTRARIVGAKATAGGDTDTLYGTDVTDTSQLAGMVIYFGRLQPGG